MKKLKKLIKNYIQRQREKKLIGSYASFLKKYNRHPFKKNFGVMKAGELADKVEINGFKIESREPLFIKE